MIRITIVPIGEVDNWICEYLRESIPKIIDNTICEIGKRIDFPPWAVDVKRNQILSIELLYHLSIQKELNKYDFVLGVIDYDIYAPGLNFIFGQAAEKIALISVTRLKPEFYGLKSNTELLKRRVLTEAIHELGHTFGISHCSNPQCVMHFSNSILDTDRKGFFFCKRCKTLLEKNIEKYK